METTNHSEVRHEHSHKSNHYKKLVWMILFSFAAMYLLMYSMVDRGINILTNINQFYMAGLMTSVMIIIELIVMGKMYPQKKANALIIAAGIIATIGFYTGIRDQTFVNDKQFLKSMIPHHAAAILMVKKHNCMIQKLRLWAIVLSRHSSTKLIS